MGIPNNNNFGKINEKNSLNNRYITLEK